MTQLHRTCDDSVTGLGDFGKFLVTNCITKVAKCMTTSRVAKIKNIVFQVKTNQLLLKQFLENMGTFYSNIWSHCL